MAFPVSPTNGQVTVVNQVSYQYSSATNSWTRILSTANVITANTIAVNGALTVGTTISSTGNISVAAGNFFIGNGSQLTGVTASSAGFPISSGNSNIAATASANIYISVAGTSNVAVFATTGEYITGVLSASGTITGGNLATGGTSSAAGNVTGGNILTAGLVSAGGTVTGTSFLGAVVSVTANVTGGNVLTGGIISATANVTGGNVLTAGLISATGTVTGSSFLGAVVSVTANVTGGNILTGGVISATGTITAGSDISLVGNLIDTGTFWLNTTSNGNINFNPNGTGQTNIPAGILNVTANVVGGNILTGGLISATANVIGGNILTGGAVSATGNATFGNISTSGSGGNISGANVISGTTLSATANVIGGNVTTGGVISATANITGGNVLTAGLVSATGNVTGNYILGNGAFLSGVITSVANINNGTSNVTVVSSGGNVTVGIGGTSNVAVFATTGEYVTGIISASGNIISAGNVSGGNILTGGLVSATSNITGGNLLTAGLVSSTGTVTGSSLLGSVVSVTANVTGGNLLTGGLASVSGNVTGGNLLTAGLISATGNIQGGNVNTNQIRNVSGNLTVGVTSGNLLLQPSGNIILSANTYINNLAYPFADSDAATKQYVDNFATTGISYHSPVVVATTTTLATTTGGTITYTQPNGAANGVGALLTTTGSFNLIDTANVQTLGTRILVKNEANAVYNGIYTWANATNIIRSVDADQYGADSTEQLSINDYFYTTGGNVNAGTAFIVSAPAGTITFGTSNITFSTFSTSQVYSANTAAGISLNGTVINAKTDGITTAFDGGGNIIVKASANLTTPNIGAATGTSLSATGNIQGGNLLTGGLISATSTITSAANITGGNVLTAGLVSATGTVTGSSLLGTVVSASANVIGGNVLTGGIVSATGNIITQTGSYFIGNGSQLTGVAATTATALTNGTTNVTTALNGNANITIAGTSNVAVFTTAGALVTGLISANGNVIGGNLTTGGQVSATANITGGNVLTAGLVSATGNVTGNYILGNGALLTGVITSVANINNGTSNVTVVSSGGNITVGVGGTGNVAVFATTGEYITGVLSASGNVTGGNILTGGLISATSTITSAANVIGGNLTTGGQVSAAANITGGNVLTGGLVSATANITGGNVLTGGLVSATANVTGGNLLTAGIISATGNIRGGNVTASNYYYANGIAIVNYTASTTPPASPTTGWQWYNTSTDVLYEYITDGTTPYWVDISSPAFAGGVVANVSISGNILNNANATYDIGSASQTFKNVYAQNYYGNGATLSGIVTSVSNINNGTSNITVVSSGGNITTSVGGTANIGVWYNAGLSITGDLTVTGNATLTGNILGDRVQNGTTSIDIQTASGNANINIGGAGNLAVFAPGNLVMTGNINPSANITYDLGTTSQRWKDLWLSNSTIYLGNAQITANATAVTITNPAGGQTVLAGASGATSVTGATVSATGNITGGNILTAGLISATGNITGGNLQVTGTIFDAGQLDITTTASNGNIVLTPNGTGNVNISSNIMPTSSNATANIGSATAYFNTMFGKATTAQYADLAENYLGDAAYVPGTVLDFDGEQEVTLSTRDSSKRVAGVVSTNPAHLMNSTLDGAHVTAVALAGRVPTQVTGKIAKGDLMVSAGNGRARAEANPATGTVIGKALENFDGGEGTIEIVISMQ